MMDKVDGKVNAAEVYNPKICMTLFCKQWAMKCGYCSKDFVKFSLTGKPKCPYCNTINLPNFSAVY